MFTHPVLQIRAMEFKYHIKQEKTNNLNTILQLLAATHLLARMYHKKEHKTTQQQMGENTLKMYNGAKVCKGRNKLQQSHISFTSF